MDTAHKKRVTDNLERVTSLTEQCGVTLALRFKSKTFCVSGFSSLHQNRCGCSSMRIFLSIESLACTKHFTSTDHQCVNCITHFQNNITPLDKKSDRIAPFCQRSTLQYF